MLSRVLIALVLASVIGTATGQPSVVGTATAEEGFPARAAGRDGDARALLTHAIKINPAQPEFSPRSRDRLAHQSGDAAHQMPQRDHGGGFSLNAPVRIEATDRKGLESQGQGWPCLARRGRNACYGIVPARSLPGSAWNG